MTVKDDQGQRLFEKRTVRKITLRIIPFIFHRRGYRSPAETPPGCANRLPGLYRLCH
jgi:hypothetical protein